MLRRIALFLTSLLALPGCSQKAAVSERDGAATSPVANDDEAAGTAYVDEGGVQSDDGFVTAKESTPISGVNLALRGWLTKLGMTTDTYSVIRLEPDGTRSVLKSDALTDASVSFSVPPAATLVIELGTSAAVIPPLTTVGDAATAGPLGAVINPKSTLAAKFLAVALGKEAGTALAGRKLLDIIELQRLAALTADLQTRRGKNLDEDDVSSLVETFLSANAAIVDQLSQVGASDLDIAAVFSKSAQTVLAKTAADFPDHKYTDWTVLEAGRKAAADARKELNPAAKERDVLSTTAALGILAASKPTGSKRDLLRAAVFRQNINALLGTGKAFSDSAKVKISEAMWATVRDTSDVVVESETLGQATSSSPAQKLADAVVAAGDDDVKLAAALKSAPASEESPEAPNGATPTSLAAPPPDPFGLAAVTNSATAITISWTNGGGTTAAFAISYRAGASAPANCAAGTQIAAAVVASATSYQITNLASGTQYSFRVCAVNANAIPDVSPGATVNGRWTSPAIPSLQASASGLTVNLAWADVVGETGYTLQRSFDGVTAWTTIATPLADATGAVDSSLSAATTYYYRLSAANSGGASAFSASTSVTTGAAPPPNPTLQVPTINSASVITLTWTSGGGSTAAFKISSQVGSQAPANCLGTAWTVGNVTAYQVTGLAPGTEYSFRLCALNGNAPPDISSGDTTVSWWTIPATPGSFTATAVSSSQINFTWADATGETGYTIEQSLDGTSGWTTIASPAANAVAAVTTGLTSLTAYYYRIQANNSGGSSSWSPNAAATTTAAWAGTKEMGVPGGLTQAFAVAADQTGNVYVGGATNGNLDGNTGSGGNDFFLTKYSSAGARQWTKQVGPAQLQAATIDPSANVFVGGYTSSGVGGNTQIGVEDAFLTKFNASGTLIWARQFGVAGHIARCQGLATDTNGNIYVGGYTDGGLDGNAIPGGTTDFFIRKYDASGSVQWTQQLGAAASTYTEAFGIALDTSANVYLSGTTAGNLDGNTLAGAQDAFVTKYNASGVKQWTKQLGVSGTFHTRSNAVATDSSNNVYMGGWTDGSLDSNTVAGWSDFFVTKYNASGTKLWTKQQGVNASSVDLRGMAVDGSDNLLITGSTSKALDGNVQTGSTDVFAIKYDASGAKQWTKQMGTASVTAYGQGIASDAFGNVFQAGYVAGGGLDGNTPTGSYDFVLTKFSPAGVKQ